jgi:hypothetical protein
MDMFLISTHEDIALQMTDILGGPLATAQRQRINVTRDFLLHQEDQCAEGRLTIELVQQLSKDDFYRYVRDRSKQWVAIAGTTCSSLGSS